MKKLESEIKRMTAKRKAEVVMDIALKKYDALFGEETK